MSGRYPRDPCRWKPIFYLAAEGGSVLLLQDGFFLVQPDRHGVSTEKGASVVESLTEKRIPAICPATISVPSRGSMENSISASRRLSFCLTGAPGQAAPRSSRQQAARAHPRKLPKEELRLRHMPSDRPPGGRQCFAIWKSQPYHSAFVSRPSSL